MAVVLVASGCTSGDTESGSLPSAAQEIIESEPYESARWSWHGVDADSGDEVLSSGADTMTLLGSTTKTFTVGTYYDRIGPDETITTPVYALGESQGGALDGDLVLVGAGDFILGSRDVAGGGLEFSAPDHVYYYVGPVTEPVEADPLSGLDDLAAQVAAAGITSIDGDVLVDDRLWDPYDSKEGVVSPIMVNDNLVDIEVSPGAAEGDPATLTVRPETAFFDVVNEVTTVAAGDTADVVAEAGDGNEVVVTGEVSADRDPFWTAYFAPDPAAYARALFIEALERAGVTVGAPLDAAEGTLPPEGSYADTTEVASLESPPAHELGKLILKVSHNRGAETFFCLLAVSIGSKSCDDGLTPILDTVEAVGIAPNATFLVDGEGSDPNSATPRALAQWLTWADDQPWADVFRNGMPDIGDGGDINSKSGTSAAPQPTTGRLFISTYAEAGYIEADNGDRVVMTLFVNSGVFESLLPGLDQVKDDMENVLIEVQQSL
jgi:D-alanyl-D-alanine carboxypeptidase/D-alanyl-D-alanine-endopeptidase (penicillin-binding protein 4)